MSSMMAHMSYIRDGAVSSGYALDLQGKTHRESITLATRVWETWLFNKSLFFFLQEAVLLTVPAGHGAAHPNSCAVIHNWLWVPSYQGPLALFTPICCADLLWAHHSHWRTVSKKPWFFCPTATTARYKEPVLHTPHLKDVPSSADWAGPFSWNRNEDRVLQTPQGTVTLSAQTFKCLRI